ncbi:hypothetical protein E3O42_10615 [Cryobacterium adonitolivorans]|uniref:DUF6993 domain-containing protein n=1 Tax=Cryobacterium adonitolivorans TaxID=1259189 RepID=A0A4R8W5Q4_9MICO|nr:hypothetical protein [Cryobacterium adonitolivorans]TFC01387.1 hypothetical protein E3O42_10615 [Cryobacterium adonitolivorans]
MRRSRRATTWAACLVLGLGLGLAGCSAAPVDGPAPTESAMASPTPTEAAPPALVPAGTATENLPYFDSVITAALSADPNAAGRSYIDALVAAGFDKTKMEVTADATTKGEPADSIQFSVNVTGGCLIGQHGPSTGGYHSVVAPLLATGTCLVGATRQIDW